MIVHSYGGGTQSIAIALLVMEGKLPRPDLVVMADTGLETTETWEYLIGVMMPLFMGHGIPFHVAGHDLANVDLYSHQGKLLIPAYTLTGKLPTYCSSEWKTYVVRRYLRSLGVEKCDMWLGMSTDEIERIKEADVQWITHHWPLCDLPVKAGYGVSMSRVACKQYIMSQGKPDPPKSSCVICPHRRNPQWERQKRLYPADHQRAVAIDMLIRKQDRANGHTGVWLHGSHKPLDEVDFSKEDQPTLFGCDSGMCWT